MPCRVDALREIRADSVPCSKVRADVLRETRTDSVPCSRGRVEDALRTRAELYPEVHMPTILLRYAPAHLTEHVTFPNL